MPIIGSFDPENLSELKEKLIATNDKPDQEEYICEQVQAHLDKFGVPAYDQAITKIKDAPLTARKCIVFLIKGEFLVGTPSSKTDGGDTSWTSVSTEWQAQLVENESTLRLQKNTAVVIIELN